MIEIQDNDSPVIAAGKIIHGTRPYAPTPLTRKIVSVLTGDESAADTVDMYDLEEIKEIADYLMVYYNSHKEGD